MDGARGVYVRPLAKSPGGAGGAGGFSGRKDCGWRARDRRCAHDLTLVNS